MKIIHELSNIDETLLKMGKTLDFMKQVTSEIKTNQTLILQVQNINEDTNNFIENEIKKRIDTYQNKIEDIQEHLMYLEKEIKDLQDKVNAKEIENAQVIPNHFFKKYNYLTDTIFSTHKFYKNINIDECTFEVTGTQQYTTLFIETPLKLISSYTEFDKKVFLALFYLLRNYDEKESKYKTDLLDIETSTQEIVNLLDLDIDEDIHNKIAKSISKIKDTRIYDKNNMDIKVNLMLVTGAIGVGNHSSNELIRIIMERNVFDILLGNISQCKRI